MKKISFCLLVSLAVIAATMLAPMPTNAMSDPLGVCLPWDAGENGSCTGYEEEWSDFAFTWGRYESLPEKYFEIKAELASGCPFWILTYTQRYVYVDNSRVSVYSRIGITGAGTQQSLAWAVGQINEHGELDPEQTSVGINEELASQWGCSPEAELVPEAGGEV